MYVLSGHAKHNTSFPLHYIQQVHFTCACFDRYAESNTAELPWTPCLPTTSMFTQRHDIDKNTAYLFQILPCPIIPKTARYHPSATYQTSALPTAYIAMAADLTHATLVRNPEYERNGLKSYVRALQKYGITPTVPGPYCLASKPESDVQGTFTDHSGKILTQEFQLVKRDAETAHAGTVPVRLTKI
jgi:hypothetical protein